MAPLNPSQKQAVTTFSGPLLVLAGAGTGKTSVVTHRIAELIRHGTPPDRILAVTFTNKAAHEMQQRVGTLLGKRLKSRPQISTFHAHCLRILRRHIRRLGYPQQFAIYDRGDQEALARSVLRDLRLAGQSLRPSDLLFQISNWKSSCIRPDEAATLAQTDKQHLAATAFRRYQRALKNAGAVDFDDILLCTEDLFAEHPDVLREEANRFDYLLVDEYQDTNGSQYRIVRSLAATHRNLCVVGDDDQSIYAWRGADVQHILRFNRDWPDATVVRLEENYRSTNQIIEYANRLIVFNKTRHDKTLRAARPGGEKPRILQCKDETQEAKAVVDDIRRQLRKPDMDPGDIAILFRTNEQPRAFEAEMRRVDVPYVLIGGTSFFDRKEVRDILAYLKLLIAPRDETSLLRIINTPPRGIGSRTVETLMSTAVEQESRVWDVLSSPDKTAHATRKLPRKAATALEPLVTLLKTYQARVKSRETSLAELVRHLIEHIGYEAELQRLYDDPEERQRRWDSVQDVVNALAEFEANHDKPGLSQFLDDMALTSREFGNNKEDQLNRGSVALMTLHCAKGLEFPQIYMVGMEEGLLPHRRSIDLEGHAIDEERRLCYVGITRAQERVTFSLARTRRKWGKPRETMASRFLYELTGQAERAPHRRARSTDGPPNKPKGHRRSAKRRPS
ncbi:MAG: UvrD-helicase domain-containing protein [Pirellulaceae bacterium]